MTGDGGIWRLSIAAASAPGLASDKAGPTVPVLILTRDPSL